MTRNNDKVTATNVEVVIDFLRLVIMTTFVLEVVLLILFVVVLEVKLASHKVNTKDYGIPRLCNNGMNSKIQCNQSIK